MAESLSFGALSVILRQAFRQLPDACSGPQARYPMIDAALATLSAFFMQCPSFLASQRDMPRRKATNNAQTLLGVAQIRNRLDPVDRQVARSFRLGGWWCRRPWHHPGGWRGRATPWGAPRPPYRLPPSHIWNCCATPTTRKRLDSRGQRRL